MAKSIKLVAGGTFKGSRTPVRGRLAKPVRTAHELRADKAAKTRQANKAAAIAAAAAAAQAAADKLAADKAAYAAMSAGQKAAWTKSQNGVQYAAAAKAAATKAAAKAERLANPVTDTVVTPDSALLPTILRMLQDQAGIAAAPVAVAPVPVAAPVAVSADKLAAAIAVALKAAGIAA